jgi:hypothetical protein
LVAALEYGLGETLLMRDRRADAMVIFQKLAANPSAYRARAIFQLAHFDLQEKSYAACADKCHQVWGERSLIESSSVLQLWGHALEGMGEYAKAAQCFAGKAPE